MTKRQKIPIIAILGLVATVFIAVQGFNVYTQWNTSDKIDNLTVIVQKIDKNTAVSEEKIENNEKNINKLQAKDDKTDIEIEALKVILYRNINKDI